MSTSELYSMRQQAANQAAQCIVHFDRGFSVKAAVGTPTTMWPRHSIFRHLFRVAVSAPGPEPGLVTGGNTGNGCGGGG